MIEYKPFIEARSPHTHNRRSIRLKGYNYSQAGAYFVTICAKNQECIFGDVVSDMIRLNECGEIVREEWLRSEEIRHEIELDEFIVMPNHIHGVVVIYAETSIVGGTVIVGATGRSPLQSQPPPGPAKRSLGSHIAGFKSAVTRHINQWRGTPYKPIWQRNYYEHVVRK